MARIRRRVRAGARLTDLAAQYERPKRSRLPGASMYPLSVVLKLRPTTEKLAAGVAE